MNLKLDASGLRDVSLADKYILDSGQIYLTGIQALVRLAIMQAKRDSKLGLNTAGFITGYRGSPLGALDQQLFQAGHLLEAVSYTHLTLPTSDLV